MNINRILINESEKQRILGLHSKHKSLITEQLTKNDFPICVRNSGNLMSDDAGNLSIVVPNGGGKGIQYQWYSNQVMKSYNSVKGRNSGLLKSYFYYCKCIEGKCRAKITNTMTKHECDDKRKCSLQTPEDKVDVNCKSKTPYNALTDAGLNWKEESRKWVEAKCNGTTPCILGNAQTNINLRNAFCDGTWGSKKEQDVQNPSLNPACSSKCSEQPRAKTPADKIIYVAQYQGYFYDSIQGKCIEVTGQSGPFGSIAECEACKCGSQSKIGDGDQKPIDVGQKPIDVGQKPIDVGQKPIDVGDKLPDFIPPTIIKPKPLD